MSLTIRSVKGSSLSQTEHDNNHKDIGWIGTNIASAATADLNFAGNRCDVTGTTGITSFGTASPQGRTVVVRFQGAVAITHNATNLILPFTNNAARTTFTTRVGDILVVQKEAAAGVDGWRVLSIVRGDGSGHQNLVQFPAIYDNGNQAGATWTLDPTKGARQKVTLTGNISTWTLTAPPDSLPTTIQLDVYQDGTGSRTLAATSVKAPAGHDKVLTTTPSARDRWVLDYDGANWVGQLMKGIA